MLSGGKLAVVHNVELMLDSGAFSAWTRNQQIDVNEYIKYVKERRHLVHSVVNLDAIPGRVGRPRTKEELDFAAVQSHHNLNRMKDAGIEAIPVFHQGENFSHLETMIDEGNPYIGISPAGDQIRFDTTWLDDCFLRCCNSKGEPIVKTHGFGVSSPQTLVRYPWYSADSATWALKSGYGSLLVPFYPNLRKVDGVIVPGKPDYTVGEWLPTSLWMTGISRDSPRFEHESNGDHYQACFRNFIEEEVQTSISTVRYSPHERMRAMLVYYNKLQPSLKYSRWSGNVPLTPYKDFSHLPVVRWASKKVIIAVGSVNSLSRSHMLNAAQVKHRLASYWEIRDLPVADLERYVTDGILRPYKQTRGRGYWGSASYENYRALALADRYGGVVDEKDGNFSSSKRSKAGSVNE